MCLYWHLSLQNTNPAQASLGKDYVKNYCRHSKNRIGLSLFRFFCLFFVLGIEQAGAVLLSCIPDPFFDFWVFWVLDKFGPFSFCLWVFFFFLSNVKYVILFIVLYLGTHLFAKIYNFKISTPRILECSSAAQRLPDKYKALSLIPYTKKKKKKSILLPFFADW